VSALAEEAVAAALGRIVQRSLRPRSPRRAAFTTNILPNMAALAMRFGPSPMPPNKPDWLDIVRHSVRGFRVPFLLVVQHHAIPARTRLVAPVSPPLPGDVDVLALACWSMESSIGHDFST